MSSPQAGRTPRIAKQTTGRSRTPPPSQSRNSPKKPLLPNRTRSLSPNPTPSLTRSKTEPTKSPPSRTQTQPASSSATAVGSSVRPRHRLPASLTSFVQALEDVLGVGYSDDHYFAKAVSRAIPSEFLLLASQDDVTQAQEDYYAMQHYRLPLVNHNANVSERRSNKAGSVATCALLEWMYQHPDSMVATRGGDPWDCRQVLQEIKDRVKRASKQEAKPIISSSRPLGPPAMVRNKYAPFYIVPPGFTGRRRGLLIGVVAGSMEGRPLKGPPNDVNNMQQFLIQHCGFQARDMLVLRDDHGAGVDAASVGSPWLQSTKQNILDGFVKMASVSKPKDVVFIQYSGHGGRLGDNLYILPADAQENGHILDDDILKDLIKNMPAKVHTTMLIDCCYSGVVGDLPYVLRSDVAEEGPNQEIETYYDTDTRQEMIQKETEGGKEYKEKKKARSKWRNIMRIPSAAAAYASDFAKDVGHGFSNAAHQAAAAATANSTTTKTKANANAANDIAPKAAAAAGGAKGTIPAPKKTTSAATSSSTEKAKKETVKRLPKIMPRGTKTIEEIAKEQEEAARRAAIQNSKKEAARERSRTPPRRIKTIEELAKEQEESARRAAVGARERSKTPPRRTKTIEELAKEQEEAARRSAVGARERSKTPPRRTKTIEELAKEQEDSARKAAIEQSRREAARARSRTPPRNR